MNLTVKALIRKFISYLAIYTLLIISFMLFVTVSGYYLFIFDWPAEVPRIAMHGFLCTGLNALAIGIYVVAEKWKEES
ncbi:hypothetical protein STN0717ENT73_26970 [Enterobacter cloacae]|jgi:hypothetical protein|nr:hypothetical protein P852_02445 [Enterobacter asburiae]KSX06625.1 hypothetical protein APT79_12845 [Enterobacter sp. K66-74]BBW46383.1 hypothetical protein STN0717ENT73_26970 [Enterobacter cloacae]RNV99030.1 hypothetical protein CAF89_013820 [Enterobacter asburiae]BBJ62718.1 hypothetical protein EAS1808013_016990 [Enterobacter asburiae]